MKKKTMDFLNDERRDSRKKEQILRNVFVALLWTLVLLPLILCIILFGKVGQLEKELNQVKEINAEAAPGSFKAKLKEMALVEEAEDDKASGSEVKENIVKAASEEKEEGVQTEKEEVPSVSPSAVEAGNISDGKKHVYLTFDDGPSDHTEDILELLEAEGMTATFFCIGKTDAHSIEMYQRIVEGGHTLAMHSYSHDYEGMYASLEAFEADFHKIQDYLEDITGEKPVYYRFPGGSSNTVSKVSMKKCIRFLESEGVPYFDWNALNGDAEGKVYTIGEMIKRTMSGVRLYDEPVVLMHDTNAKQATLEMLPKLIKKLKKMDAVVEGINENTPLVQHIKVSSVVNK